MSRRTEHGVARDGEPKRMPAKGRTCGQSNGPEWCPDPVFARGLCRKHYRRAAKGFPVDPDDGKRVGVTPSGFGTWGVVDEQDGRLLCHECGGWFRSLGVHIGMRHGSVRDYRMKHGLLLSQSLNAPDVRRRLADAASRPESLWRIKEARDPVRAGRKADAEITNRGRRLRRQSPGGR